jgi:kumamolisin
MHQSHKTFGPRTATALTPDKVAKAYSFPVGVDLTKRTVAILELGGLFNLSDVVAYCNKYGFKVPQITTVLVDGAAQSSSDADGEVCLDIDVIAAVAQGCKIAVVFAPNSDKGFIDGMAACLALDPDAISISWGSPESGWEAASMAALDALFLQAAEKGIAVYCASGDSGSKDGTGSNVTDYPACSPYAIACGGTRLELNADGTRLTESAWSTKGGLFGSSEGSGGGISKVYSSTPHWQANILNADAAGRRSPDVSGNADPATGYIVDINGETQQVGGTSAVAPLYAALQCIMNAVKDEHVGNMHSKMYGLEECFFDVTVGTNDGYNCGPGYDLVTGLGVIDAQEFLANI